MRELDAVALGAREGPARALFRVPLLIEDRDAVAMELRRRRIKIYWSTTPFGRLRGVGLRGTIFGSGSGPMVGIARSAHRPV